MNEVEKLVNNLSSINIPEIITDILRQRTTLDTIEQIIRDRLYLEGTDSDNNKFRTDSAKRQGNASYAGFTYQEKKRKGQKATNVTFRDTGGFHRSIKAKVPNKTVFITGDFEKDFSNIYDNFRTSYSSENQFKDAVLGLTDKQKEYIAWEVVYPKLMERLRKIVGV